MNSKALKDLLDRIPFAVLMVAYLGYLGYDYLYVFKSDPGSPLIQKQQQLVATKDEVAKLETKVRQVNDFIQTLNATRSEIRALVQELEDMRATLSESIDQAELMKSLLTEAKRSGLNVTSLRPVDRSSSNGYRPPDPNGKEQKEEYYSEQNFQMESTGIFFQYVAFLDRIANLRKIVRVDNVSFTSDSPSRAKYVNLKGTLQLKAYRYVGGKADEVVKTLDRAAPASATGLPGGATAKPAGGTGT